MYCYSPTKLFSLGALTMIAGAQQVSAQKNDHEQRPNIILILADDMGYSDIGCFGSEISTPNLDKLANEGMRATRFYNASRSCPSRASLLTGLYQHEAGIGDMVGGNYGVPAYQGFINRQSVTLAEALKSNGYNTYMSGKWHVGEAPENWPVQRGFDHFFGLIGGASNYFKLISYRKNQAPSRMALEDKPYTPPDSGFYMTNAITDYALKFLDGQKQSSNPFFLYLPFTAPHWPLHALPEDIAKYKGKYMQGWDKVRENRFRKMQKLGIIDKNLKLSPRFEKTPDWASLSRQDQEMWDLRMAVYAAMIDRLDQSVGRLMKKLEEMKVKDNTLIVFMSDNGGCHEQIKNKENYIPTTAKTGTPESFDSYEYNWANVSNTPFRLFKHWVHEGGISTPFIAWYPKMIKAGTINRTPAHIIDVLPTFLAVANGKYPQKYNGNTIQPMEGINLLPMLQGKSVKRDSLLFWEHEGNWAVSDGKWKLVSQYNNETAKFGPSELYDITVDRTELNNLSQSHPEVVARLTQAYDKWANRVGVISREKVDAKRSKKGGGE